MVQNQQRCASTIQQPEPTLRTVRHRLREDEKLQKSDQQSEKGKSLGKGEAQNAVGQQLGGHVGLTGSGKHVAGEAHGDTDGGDTDTGGGHAGT